MKPALVLRPEPGATETSRRLRARGLEAIVVPLFAIQPVAWTPSDPSRYGAIMITSANAARHGGTDLMHYRTLPAFAVGAATAAAMRAIGFADVRKGRSDADSLLDDVARAGFRRVLHLCGEDRREAEAASVAVERIAVYAACALDDPAGLDAAILRQPVALLHSPRAAARLAELIEPDRRGTVAIAAISARAADAAGANWSCIAVAEAPREAALLALAIAMCENLD